MPSSGEKSPESKQFKWMKSEKGIVELYSNYVHPTWTLYDVRLVFGQLMAYRGDPAGKGFIIEEQGGVTMSWGHAKVLRDILTKIVESYEKVNGEIKPPQLAQPEGSLLQTEAK